MLTDDSTTWVSPDPVVALEFVLAGVLAEKIIVGHELPGSFEGDITLWRRGAGSTGEMTYDEYLKLLGESLVEVVNRTKQWVRESRSDICRVASTLAGKEITGTVPLEINGDLRLSESEVLGLLGDP